jgi:hypothetical protein
MCVLFFSAMRHGPSKCCHRRNLFGSGEPVNNKCAMAGHICAESGANGWKRSGLELAATPKAGVAG